MSKYIAIAFTALLTLTAFSPSNEDIQDDARSRAVLDKLIAKSKTFKTFTASYTNRLQSEADGLDITQKGTIQAKGKQFKLTSDDFTIFCNGETVWTYSPESNEVNISDPSELGAEELDPSKLLTIYEKGFKSQFVEEKNIEGSVHEVIKLFPLKAGEKPYHTVVLTVDKAKLEVSSIKILYKDGNEVTYTITSFKANMSIDDSTFLFPKDRYPGVEENDMR